MLNTSSSYAEAKVQASKIVADAKAGEDVKADITAKAQAEAAGMIEKAHVAIEAEREGRYRRPSVLSPTSRLTSRPSSSATT